jgi:hypothetical protein
MNGVPYITLQSLTENITPDTEPAPAGTSAIAEMTHLGIDLLVKGASPALLAVEMTHCSRRRTRPAIDPGCSEGIRRRMSCPSALGRQDGVDRRGAGSILPAVVIDDSDGPLPEA